MKNLLIVVLLFTLTACAQHAPLITASESAVVHLDKIIYVIVSENGDENKNVELGLGRSGWVPSIPDLFPPDPEPKPPVVVVPKPEPEPEPPVVVVPVPKPEPPPVVETKEKLRFNGYANGNRGHWIGKMSFSRYPSPMKITIPDCNVSTTFRHNGVRYDEGINGMLVKQSDVPGRGMVMVYDDACRSQVAYAYYY